jgi:hypothetical protein
MLGSLTLRRPSERFFGKEERFMAQEQMVLRRIDWQGAFPWTRLFGAFRSALHSTRIVLALAGLALTFLLGGVLDQLWVSSGQGVWPGEIVAYAASGGRTWNDASILEARGERLADLLVQTGVTKDRSEARQLARANPASSAENVQERIASQYQDARKAAQSPEAQVRLTADMHSRVLELRNLEPIGPFHEYVGYQLNTARAVVFAAAQLRFTEGLDGVLHGEAPLAAQVRTVGLPIPAEQPGVLAGLVMLWYGLVWLLKMHWFYSLIFTPVALAIWAMAGGGISRAAVVQFARDERIGLPEALRFATTKFWGFFFAPVVSLVFVLAFGVLLMAGGLVGSIPVVGDILVGVLWFLALVAGMAIAFITVGLLAGGHLFAPVIAAEGSDAFDAISRGFVYVYSRPWKSLLYGLILIVYGSICYLFLRFFVFMMLVATHAFVGAGMLAGRPEAGVGQHKLDVVWQMPTYVDLRPHPFEWQLLGVGESILFCLIALWTYAIWGLLQSWLISFYFTGSSMAYLLLRKDVDAMEAEEIYTEEEPEAESLVEPAGGPTPATVSGTPAGASPMPPPTPPAGPGPSVG